VNLAANIADSINMKCAFMARKQSPLEKLFIANVRNAEEKHHEPGPG
jgi:hypothetical protein